MNQILKLAVELAVNSHTTAVPEFPLYDLVAQHNGNVMCPVPMCWDHPESRFFLHLITKTKHWNRKYVNSCLGRKQKGTKFNPLKGELTPHWTQPLSSNIGLLNIEDLWPAKMHLESFYITCLCVTPVLRSRGLIYKPEEKERRVAANARHSADGLEWPGGEQKGYWVMEGYWWQHQGTAICQQQYLVFPSPHPVNPSGGAFCVTVCWHADRSLTDKHRTPRHRALLAFPLRVYSFPSTYRVPGQDPVLVLCFQ